MLVRRKKLMFSKYKVVKVCINKEIQMFDYVPYKRYFLFWVNMMDKKDHRRLTLDEAKNIIHTDKTKNREVVYRTR